MIGISCGVSLSSSTAHLPTLASPLSSGADGGCGSPPRVVVTGGTWGLRLALAEHPAHMSSLGAHGGAARITPAAASVVVHCVTLWWRGHSTTPLSWLGSHAASTHIGGGHLAAASSWPSLGSLASSSWLGSHAAHGLGRESQRPRHGWDHMRSASERRRAAGSLLSGSRAANLKASWRGGQGLMPLVAGIDAAVSSLLSSLQWSCLPSPYAP